MTRIRSEGWANQLMSQDLIWSLSFILYLFAVYRTFLKLFSGYSFTSFSGHRPACPEGMCTKGTQVPFEVPSLPNPTTHKGWPHHWGLRPLLFSHSDVGSFTSDENKSVKVLWDGTYGFSSLFEKTRKCNHLQMSLQRQHFLLSYLRPWVLVRAGFEPATSRSADRRSPNWANQANWELRNFCGDITTFWDLRTFEVDPNMLLSSSPEESHEPPPAEWLK